MAHRTENAIEVVCVRGPEVLVTTTFDMPAGVPVVGSGVGVLPQPTMAARSPRVRSSRKQYRRRCFLPVVPPPITMPRKAKPVSAATTEPAPPHGLDSIAVLVV